MTGLNKLANQYNDLQNIESSFIPDCLSSNLNHMAFVLITPDSIERDLVDLILTYILNATDTTICGVKLKYLTEIDVETLYKFAFAKPGNGPSFMWLLKKSLTLGPSIAVMLRRKNVCAEKPLCEEILQLKGSFSQNLAYKGETIRERFGVLSRALAVVHSSDDIYSVIRESKIFFSKREIISLMESTQRQIEIQQVTSLIGNKNLVSGKELVNNLISRIKNTLKICHNEIYDQLSESIKDISNLNSASMKKIMDISDELADIMKCLILLLEKRTEYKDINIQNIAQHIRDFGVYLNTWEEVILQNELLFY